MTPGKTQDCNHHYYFGLSSTEGLQINPSGWTYCSKTSWCCSEPQWPIRPHSEATTTCPNFLLISQRSSVIIAALEKRCSLQDHPARLSNSTLWSKRTWYSGQQRDKQHVLALPHSGFLFIKPSFLSDIRWVFVCIFFKTTKLKVGY